jgi:hypothetical protein
MGVPILDIGDSPWDLALFATYLLWIMSNGNPVLGALFWVVGIFWLLDKLTP